MLRVVLDAGAQEDIERILEHLVRHGVADAGERMAHLISAADILGAHPHIGRPVGDGLRELIIGRGSRGYVARYRVVDAEGIVLVLAIRGQPEQGFQRPG